MSNRFKMTPEQAKGLATMLQRRKEMEVGRGLRSRWLKLMLHQLCYRLHKAADKASLEGRRTVLISIPLPEAYALCEAFETTPVDVTSYIGNVLVQIMQNLQKLYN